MTFKTIIVVLNDDDAPLRVRKSDIAVDDGKLTSAIAAMARGPSPAKSATAGTSSKTCEMSSGFGLCDGERPEFFHQVVRCYSGNSW